MTSLRLVRDEGKRSRPEESMQSIGDILRTVQPVGPAPADLYWACPQCGPIQPLATPTGHWIKRGCECTRRARKEAEQAEIEASWQTMQQTRTYGGWLGKTWIDQDVIRQMVNQTFATYKRDRFPVAFDKAYSFARALKGNLVLYGSYGTGKSHLEAAICNFQRVERHAPSIFISAPELFMAVKEAEMRYDKTEYHSILQQLKECPLLVIDDVDKSQPRDERFDLYFVIMDARSKGKRPTVMSTNKIKTLNAYIGDAAMSRISRGLLSAPMIGTDYRLEED